jgi:hypothetical protein
VSSQGNSDRALSGRRKKRQVREDLLLELDDGFEHLIGLLGRGQRKEFDLGELVQAVQSSITQTLDAQQQRIRRPDRACGGESEREWWWLWRTAPPASARKQCEKATMRTGRDSGGREHIW